MGVRGPDPGPPEGRLHSEGQAVTDQASSRGMAAERDGWLPQPEGEDPAPAGSPAEPACIAAFED